MESNVYEVVKILTEQGKKIATMESCTGGGVANAITNIEGASEVISFSAVTYSNDFKIKMGVPKETIEKFTVYSKETARDMAKAISQFADSNFGIGITGKMNRSDKNNQVGADNIIYFSIYNRDENCYYDQTVSIDPITRKEGKEKIINLIMILLLKTL